MLFKKDGNSKKYVFVRICSNYLKYSVLNLRW